MKTKPLSFILFLFIAFLLNPIACLAKEISLYDQPKADAKVVATADTSAGIVLIFQPKDSDWVKVGDPRNGNVGWMKGSDLATAGSQSSFTFTQRVINDNKSPSTFRVIQFGQPKNLTPEQMQTFEKQIQLQQQKTQQSMQNMMRDMDQLFRSDNFPTFMPVLILPVEKSEAAKLTTQSTSTTNDAQPAKSDHTSGKKQ